MDAVCFVKCKIAVLSYGDFAGLLVAFNANFGIIVDFSAHQWPYAQGDAH